MEITAQIPEQVIQIASGGFHTMALTEENKLYAFGKLSKGQFAQEWAK